MIAPGSLSKRSGCAKKEPKRSFSPCLAEGRITPSLRGPIGPMLVPMLAGLTSTQKEHPV